MPHSELIVGMTFKQIDFYLNLLAAVVILLSFFDLEYPFHRPLGAIAILYIIFSLLYGYYKRNEL